MEFRGRWEWLLLAALGRGGRDSAVWYKRIIPSEYVCQTRHPLFFSMSNSAGGFFRVRVAPRVALHN